MKKIIILLVVLIVAVGIIVIFNSTGKSGPQPPPPPHLLDQTQIKPPPPPPPTPSGIRIGFPKKGIILNHYGETLARTNILEKNYLIGSVNALDEEFALKTAIMNKNIDVAFFPEFQSILTLGTDFNGIIIANLGSLGRSALMVPYDSTIQNINELKGRKIAVTFNTAEYLTFLGWLKRETLEVGKDMELVNTNDPEKLNVLKNGQVAAIVVTDPIVESYTRQKLCRTIYDSHHYGVVLMSKDFWTKEPKATLRFITALKEAILFISTHKAEVNSWVKGYCGMEEDLLWGCAGINVGYYSTRKINEAKLFITDVSVGNLRNISNLALEQKLIYKKMIIGDAIVQEIQDEAKREIDPKEYDPSSVKIVK